MELRQKPHAPVEGRILSLARQPARLMLVMLASSGGLAASPSWADQGNIQPITPVVAKPLKINPVRQGVQIDTTPYGYYEGSVPEGEQFNEVAVTKAKDYAGGMVSLDKGSVTITQCGWIAKKNLTEGKSLPVPQNSACTRKLGVLANRYTFGKGFNCPPGECVDGTFGTSLTPKCDDRVYYNYASAGESSTVTKVSRKDSGLYDYAGKISDKSLVHYRYTTRNGEAAVVRTSKYGWAFMSKACIAGYPQGGTTKARSSSVAAYLSR